jgi:hypothetical protein
MKYGPFNIVAKAHGDAMVIEVSQKPVAPLTNRSRRRERRFKAIHKRELVKGLMRFKGERYTPELFALIMDTTFSITDRINERFGHLTPWGVT